MKTQNNKLDFRKESVIELNDERLQEVTGGTSLPLAISLSVYAITIQFDLL